MFYASLCIVPFFKIKFKVPIPIPRDVNANEKYQIRVQGLSGFTFYNTTEVRVENKFLSLLTQTDKGFYKAGQTGREC